MQDNPTEVGTEPNAPAQNVKTEPVPLVSGIQKAGPPRRPPTKPGPSTVDDVQG